MVAWKPEDNPSSPPFTKGGIYPLFCNPFPVTDRQRGARGDFRNLCLPHYGLISKYGKLYEIYA